jgi:hypothetical protein
MISMGKIPGYNISTKPSEKRDDDGWKNHRGVDVNDFVWTMFVNLLDEFKSKVRKRRERVGERFRATLLGKHLASLACAMTKFGKETECSEEDNRD